MRGSPSSDEKCLNMEKTLDKQEHRPREGRGLEQREEQASRIGCYQGFAFTWQCLLSGCTSEKDSKKRRVLDSFLGMMQKFPYADPTYAQLHEDLHRIRGKFKQVCSLLNVQPNFQVGSGGATLSF
ncbi:protein LTO1 homolog [Petaurus breviceps papuanus]|uniref:protein LTO1 homolog n=1 Tax=Petaurus breviceps papuanus TaxID=3040969 RepID=UPI0036D88830